MASTPSYQYRPLVENDGIRLLELEPDPDLEARIKCSLIHTTLHEYDHDLINHYTALSYVWGNTQATKSILIEGLQFDITLNLDAALRYMRDPTRRCLIWADAICINQADDKEKNCQVRQMGEVYQNATHTIIFLGEPTENTDTVLKTLRSGASVTPNDVRDTLPWKDILERSWFQRVWVYQELIFSVDPWVQCGKARVRWEMLYQTVKTLKQANRHIHPWKDILLMEEGRRRFVNHSGVSAKTAFIYNLLGILDARRGLGVLDPRDMLFAHRGILGHPPGDGDENKLIDVDYMKDCVDVYRDIVKYTLYTTRDYGILSHAEVNSSVDRSDLHPSPFPTWVPDWTHQTSLYPHRRLRDAVNFLMAEEVTSKDVTPSENYETKTKYYYSAQPWFLDSDRLLLCIPGSQVGTLCLVSDLVTKQEVSLRLESGCMKEGQYTHGTRKAMESVIFHHWKGILDFLMATQTSEVSLPGGGHRPKFKQEIHSCIAQTDVEVVESTFNEVLFLGKFERLIRHIVLHAMTDGSSEYPHFLCGRRFAKLQNGRLVLVPGRAKVGDKVCFFHGDFTIPFLLREYKQLNGSADVDAELRNIHGAKEFMEINHFEFVGECLIDELVRKPAERVARVLKVGLLPELFVLH